MTTWFNVGKLVNTHGVRGEVRVLSTTDFAEERYAAGSTLKIAPDARSDGVQVVVRSHRIHKNFDLLTFEGMNNINDVEGYKGQFLFVSKKDLSELEEHEFYHHEIVGCTVVSDEGEELGKVKEIFETGANDVWVVQRKGKKDLLLPYIEEAIKEVDVEERVIQVHVMEGLDE
ncbi:ribosome maturation factor RimM [Shouchella shacheensis]|uniref:ribosome maturation factor RimM n=1 Tax=Shouchella shacheensis TaxID=1649580 RepID=UPI00073FF826|nr:ribosome maturation factor RimM [Shouchella shacheensis]